MIEDEIREIRIQLRRAMNGVTSTSMREKGINYALNFGVSIPEIKQIAATHEPNAELAEALWKEDIREFKILATLLQPVDTFTHEQVQQWVEEIPYLEIAEQCSKNLFSKLPKADDLAVVLTYNLYNRYSRIVAFLIWTEWFVAGKTLSTPWRACFLVEATRTLTVEGFAGGMEKQAAVKALKFYGRQSAMQAEEILEGLKSFPISGTSEQQEFYNDLKFEFEYYH